MPDGEKFYFDNSSQFQQSIAISPDGKWFACGPKPGNHSLWLHSVKDRMRVHVESSEWLHLVVFDFNSKPLKINSSSEPETIISIPELDELGDENNIEAFSRIDSLPDGKGILFSSYHAITKADNGSIIHLDLSTKKMTSHQNRFIYGTTHLKPGSSTSSLSVLVQMKSP